MMILSIVGSNMSNDRINHITAMSILNGGPITFVVNEKMKTFYLSNFLAKSGFCQHVMIVPPRTLETF